MVTRQTRNPVLCFAASGTGAMEAAVANLIRPGDTAVAASCGKFGERWAQMCDAYGAATTHVEFEYGEKVDPQRLDAAIARNDEHTAMLRALEADADEAPSEGEIPSGDELAAELERFLRDQGGT